MTVKQSKEGQVNSCAINSACQLANYVVSWQCPIVSVGCLVTVNAIYWVIMPMTSTITTAAVVGSLLMLVDIAAYLQVCPSEQQQQQQQQNEETECCSCNALSNVWSSPLLKQYFPSIRSRVRFLIGLASVCGLFVSSVLGLQLSTLVYIGASFFLLSKPLCLSQPSEFPIVARFFDSVIALRPDASSICSSPTSSPSPDPVLRKTRPDSKNTSLVFHVDPLEMELAEKPVFQQEQDELAPFLPSQSAIDEDLISNPESTEEISASLLPTLGQVVDESLIMSLRYASQQDDADFTQTDEDAASQEDFELVDSTSESASLSNMPTS